jgi:DNA-binding MarR family transcriptional regulator
VTTTRKTKRTPAGTRRQHGLSVGDKLDSVGYNLVELYDMYLRLLGTRSDSRLLELNLTQWRTLMLIRFNPDQTQRALATAVGVDPSSMTPIIDLFEKKGWVRRHDARNNRSAYQIRMTPQGSTVYDQVEREIGHMEDMIRERLGEPAHRTLVKLLRRLHADLGRGPGPGGPPARRVRSRRKAIGSTGSIA